MRALFSKRVIFAAAKLALFYIALVVLAFAALDTVYAFNGGALSVDIGAMAAWLAIPFAGAFILLAVARRWGFLVLWGILGGLWTWLVLDSGALRWPRPLPLLFIFWSVFALPLWIIGQAGIPRPSQRRVSPAMAVLLGWAILLVIPLIPLAARSLTDAIAFIWAPIPFILSAFAMGHVWRGTRPVAV